MRVSWLMPFGALLFCGFRWHPGVLLAYPIVVLVHELGHAALARRRRLRVHSVDLDALGGKCVFGGDVSALDLQIVSWGGVLAQALLAAIAFAVFTFVPPSTQFLAELQHGFIEANLFMALFNLVPIAPLDGHEAWQLPRTLYRRWNRRRTSIPPKARPRKSPPARIDPDAVAQSVTEALERAREEAKQSRQKQRDKT